MRVQPVFALAALALLGACHASITTSDDHDGDNVQMAFGNDADGKQKVSVNIPGFSANVTIPKVDIGGNMDLDGLKLAPDTKVHGVDVDNDKDDGKDSGKVHISFANPRAPGAVMDYYRKALVDAGYRLGATDADGLAATKEDKSFALKVMPDAAGSTGTIDITDTH